MAIKTETQTTNGKTDIFVTDTVTKLRWQVYRIDKDKEVIKFFPGKDRRNNDTFFLKEITLEGFKKLPIEFSQTGYVKAGALYYLNKKLNGKSIKKVTISKPRESSYNVSEVVINYSDFQRLKKRLSRIAYEAKIDKGKYADEFFYDTFPNEFTAQNETSKTRYLKVINNIDNDIIPHFDNNSVTRFEDFYEQLLATKYKNADKKVRFVTRTKIKIDKLAVDNVIAEFEKLLIEATSEADWGKFLLKNLFLVDSKYIKAIQQLNVVLAGARKVDFGLVDYQGHLDIFEIKRPTSKLLSTEQDRGNFYFHTDIIKALTQAEKYLYQAEGKRDTLEKDILIERDTSVKVIKPRAILLIGQTAQLDTEKKKIDFRILRNSLKNIEIVMFDELLDRLKNLKGKVFE
ncbi:MAG: DUF4263 domain-containing protein [Bacteroidetes bacterium]|nr:DUF4263 domain-containing protein [Bacteroidota bacterium]